jgi:Sec-independent protein translocase protein TatA
MKALNLFLVLVLATQTSAEVFSAVEELEPLTKQSGNLIKEFRSLINDLEETLDHLKR